MLRQFLVALNLSRPTKSNVKFPFNYIKQSNSLYYTHHNYKQWLMVNHRYHETLKTCILWSDLAILFKFLYYFMYLRVLPIHFYTIFVPGTCSGQNWEMYLQDWSTQDFEPMVRCWEFNTGCLKKQPLFFIDQPSLKPPLEFDFNQSKNSIALFSYKYKYENININTIAIHEFTY